MPAADDSLTSFALGHPLHYLWGLAADLAFAVYTLTLGPLAILLVLLTRSGKPVDVLGRLWAKLIVWTCGINLELEGLHHLQPGRSYVIISNHLSNFDIFCTLARLPTTVRFVAKKELLRIPVFGHALGISDHIVIDRQNPELAIQTINAAVARSIEGVCILFYAEGTRSPDGRVGPFKKGGVTLALNTQLPILPLSVSGTRRFLPKSAKVIRPGGRVKIVLDAPIETTGLDLDARDQLNDEVRRVVIKNFIEEY